MKIGLVAGESSGDLLGAGLISALRQLSPGIRCEGVAGHGMLAAGCDSLGDAERLAVVGLIEPLRRVPELLRLRRNLVRHWRNQPPDVFVGIDAPDFNLGLERKLKSSGIPTIHYVSPSVWAWRQKRVRTIGESVNKVLCLLPFEKVFYDQHNVPADFVGHPLADRVPKSVDASIARAALGLRAARVVTVMPGSRMSEITRLGPVFIEAAAILRQRYGDIEFVTPLATNATQELFQQQLVAANMDEVFTLVMRRSEQAIIAGDAVLLASGTAALETALLCRAMVAAYRLAPFTYFLAQVLRLIKVKHFTLPNHLTSEPLVPEFLQGAASPTALASSMAALLDDPSRRQAIEATFATLRDDLAKNADVQAAKAVLAMAQQAPATL